MNKKQTAAEYLRLFDPKDLNEEKEVYKIITDAAVFLLYNNNPASSIADRDGDLLYQITVTKCLSISKLVENKIAYSNDFTDLKMKIFDPFGLQPIIRAQFEAYGNFHNIYINHSSEDEKLLKYQLWAMCGLLERQKLPATTDESKKKKEEEKKDIQGLKASILENSCFKSLSKESQDLILNKAKRPDWKLTIIGENAVFVGWQQLFNNCGRKNQILEQLYRKYSLDSHPSYLSIIQFRNMYDPNDISEATTKLALKISGIIMCFFIADYCEFSSNAKTFFNKLPALSQLLINSNNRSIRGEEYKVNSINDEFIESIAKSLQKRA